MSSIRADSEVKKVDTLSDKKAELKNLTESAKIVDEKTERFTSKKVENLVEIKVDKLTNTNAESENLINKNAELVNKADKMADNSESKEVENSKDVNDEPENLSDKVFENLNGKNAEILTDKKADIEIKTDKKMETSLSKWLEESERQIRESQLSLHSLESDFQTTLSTPTSVTRRRRFASGSYEPKFYRPGIRNSSSAIFEFGNSTGANVIKLFTAVSYNSSY